MKIKQLVIFIANVNNLLLVGLFVPVVLIVMKARDGKFLLFEMLMMLPFVIAFLFRNWIIKYAMRRCAYPGVFYAVSDKLGLTHKVEIHLTDSMLDEIYKPTYSTEQFISDNQLHFGIVKKKVRWLPSLVMVLLGVASFVYFSNKTESSKLMFFMAGASVVFGLYTLIADRLSPVQVDISLVFQKEALHISGYDIEWRNLYDWSYQRGSEAEPEKIILSFYDSAQVLRDLNVVPASFNLDKIEFLMLLTHFKGKYGNVMPG